MLTGNFDVGSLKWGLATKLRLLTLIARSTRWRSSPASNDQKHKLLHIIRLQACSSLHALVELESVHKLKLKFAMSPYAFLASYSYEHTPRARTCRSTVSRWSMTIVYTGESSNTGSISPDLRIGTLEGILKLYYMHACP